jgi:hypothetical protein
MALRKWFCVFANAYHVYACNFRFFFFLLRLYVLPTSYTTDMLIVVPIDMYRLLTCTHRPDMYLTMSAIHPSNVPLS